MDINSLFFSLLQLGAGLTDRIELPVMNQSLWASVFSMAQKQAVAGIMLDAVNALPKDTEKPHRDMLLKLLSMGIEIEKKNRMVNHEARKWCEFFREKRLKPVLLKGQGLACLYPNPLHRTPGDIDMWVIGDEKEVRKLAMEELGAEDVTYHHIGVHSAGKTELEIHTRPSWMYSYPKNKSLQKMFLSWQEKFMEAELPDEGRISVPTDEMNRVYLLIHMFRHVFSEGIGLRQMMDYAMLLRKGATDEEKALFCTQVKELNLYGFAGAVMYVMKKVFGLKDDVLLTPPDMKKGEQLLDMIMEGGNFGQYNKDIDRTIKKDSAMSFITRNRRNLRLLNEYPEEVLWGPAFKIWHWVWRIIKRRFH